MIGHFVHRQDLRQNPRQNLRRTWLGAVPAALAVAGLCGFASPAQAQYRQEIGNDPAQCRSGPAVNVTVTGIKSSAGTVRVQLYRGTKQDWLATGRWLNRIEVPARAGSMTFCLPAPAAGSYGVAVRHDVNNNGKTDLSQDGGGMSNNPSINIFNLGKPSYTKTVFQIGDQPTSISIRMRYM
jgi:uncharacterized protein (DUF2141 family)